MIVIIKCQLWWCSTVCAYFKGTNDHADVNVLVDPRDDWVKQESTVRNEVARHLGQEKIDAILNIAGEAKQ